MEKAGDLVRLLGKKLSYLFFNISKFSQDLLDGLEKLDTWPNKVKTMQKLINHLVVNKFCVDGELPIKNIKCFTTRPDTLFGFSFLALSVDRSLNFIVQTKSLLNLKKSAPKQDNRRGYIVGEKLVLRPV